MCNLGEALYEDAKQEGIEVGMKAGMEAGMEEKLKRLISLKLAKGMKLSEIAQLLEEDEEYVRELASRL